MFSLHLTAVLALVLALDMVAPQVYPYRHRHVPPRHYRGGYGPGYGYKTPYATGPVSGLIGKPAKVVRVVKVTVPSHNHGRPHGHGHPHRGGSGSQPTFGVSRVPASSFVAPGNTGFPGNPQGTSGHIHGVPGNIHSAPGNVLGAPTNIQGSPQVAPGPTHVIPGKALGVISPPSNVPGIVQGPSNTGDPVSSGEVLGSLLEGVDIRNAPAASGSARGGSCPPTRPSCTTFRTSPPTCQTDDLCPQGHKCCFDTCVQKNICKSVI